MNMNVIGPFHNKEETDDTWDEIICNNRSIYYYFKKVSLFLNLFNDAALPFIRFSSATIVQEGDC